MKNRFSFIRLSLAAFVLFPMLASAHTRWFAHSELAPFVTTEPTSKYLAIWGTIALVIVLIGAFLEKRKILSLSFIHPKSGHAFPRAAATLSMVTGAFLLIAGTHEYLFSPNLSFFNGAPLALIVIQIIIGISLLIGFYERIAALCLIPLWLTIFTFADFTQMIENIWVVSVALFIAIMGNDYFDIFPVRAFQQHAAPFKHYALPILRIGTGLTLFILGFSEKILHPEFGINFLKDYHWNFMQPYFPGYTDYLFTISAGTVESLFGLIFILGIVTRLNALAIAIFFTLPIFILGPIELAGHLPHFCAVVLLLLFGSGEHFKLIRPKDNHHPALS